MWNTAQSPIAGFPLHSHLLHLLDFFFTMFESFSFSASPFLGRPSPGFSPTNTGLSSHGAAVSNTKQSAPSSINDLAIRLRAQTLHSANLPQRCSPVRTEYLPSPPMEDIEIGFPTPSSPKTAQSPPDYTFTPPLDRNRGMVHPNLFSSFQPRTADQSSRRTQRQILQEQQCRPAFTRDLKQLLEAMVEKEDQCRCTSSPPPPPRGRLYRTSSLGTSSTICDTEDEGFCESDHSEKSSRSLTTTTTSTTTHSQRSASETRKGARHRRVASESNIDIDFDTDDTAGMGGFSLRRAGAPVGIVKLGRLRGRGDLSPRPADNSWRKNMPRIRRWRKEMSRTTGSG